MKKYNRDNRLAYTSPNGAFEVYRNSETEYSMGRGAYIRPTGYNEHALIPVDEISSVIEALLQIEEQYADMAANGNPELEPEYDARAVIAALPAGAIFRQDIHDAEYTKTADGLVYLHGYGDIQAKYFPKDIKIVVVAP